MFPYESYKHIVLSKERLLNADEKMYLSHNSKIQEEETAILNYWEDQGRNLSSLECLPKNYA